MQVDLAAEGWVHGGLIYGSIKRNLWCLTQSVAMVSGVRPLLLIAMFCAGCSRNSDAPGNDESKPDAAIPVLEKAMPKDSATSIESLRGAAESGGAEAQRELAGRLLFGKDGIPADPEEALIWARKAANNGDETAMLWTGRAALDEPVGRIEAGAWFLIAKDGTHAAIRQDAAGELDALGLSNDELARAIARAAEMKQQIRINLK
jgi:TPR repeat protein